MFLVNNAGITNDKLMLKMTEEDFERLENQLDWCLQYDTSCLETNV